MNISISSQCLNYYLFKKGVRASEKMASTDLGAMAQWKNWIYRAGNELCVQPAVIAGKYTRSTLCLMLIRFTQDNSISINQE